MSLVLQHRERAGSNVVFYCNSVNQYSCILHAQVLHPIKIWSRVDIPQANRIRMYGQPDPRFDCWCTRTNDGERGRLRITAETRLVQRAQNIRIPSEFRGNKDETRIPRRLGRRSPFEGMRDRFEGVLPTWLSDPILVRSSKPLSGGL